MSDTITHALYHSGRTIRRSELRQWAIAFVNPQTVWILLVWAGVNAGPWYWQSAPEGFQQWVHAIRTGAPLLVVLAGLVALFRRSAPFFTGPLKLLGLYGCVGLLGCFVSPYPLAAFFWGCVYMSIFTGTMLYLKTANISEARRLNQLSWAITMFILTAMVLVARDQLFVTGPTGLTAYGVVHRVGEAGGMIISRASGFARFAAVPAVAGFVMFWNESFGKRVIGACIFVPSALLVWFLQSRGAIFGLAFALCFVAYFLSRRSRWVSALGGLFCLLFLWTDTGAERWIDYIQRHVSRGQAIEEMVSMTGRERAWRHGWMEIYENPIIGQGFQADRYTIGEHVHNTYMYALMTAGFVGATFFCMGLVWAWWLFWQAWKGEWGRRAGQHTHLIQVGGILAFFTVRSIPEVSGAMYSIDQFLMVPAIAYLTILSRVAGKRRKRNARKFPVRVSARNPRVRGEHGGRSVYHRMDRKRNSGVRS